MRSLLYIIAVILVIGWILGAFVYSAGSIIHNIAGTGYYCPAIRIYQTRFHRLSQEFFCEQRLKGLWLKP